jgi:hypothetical protein
MFFFSKGNTYDDCLHTCFNPPVHLKRICVDDVFFQQTTTEIHLQQKCQLLLQPTFPRSVRANHLADICIFHKTLQTSIPVGLMMCSTVSSFHDPAIEGYSKSALCCWYCSLPTSIANLSMQGDESKALLVCVFSSPQNCSLVPRIQKTITTFDIMNASKPFITVLIHPLRLFL